ncbi:MAG: hypothetical protein LPJ87_05100 [Zoogloeaceae bacterium]|nr:hypothetical protein [Zoogloeaceae bacterium]
MKNEKQSSTQLKNRGSLTSFRKIFVIANSRNMRGQTSMVSEEDLLIVFNRNNTDQVFSTPSKLTISVHRMDGHSRTYFGASHTENLKKKPFHVCISEDPQDSGALPDWCNEYIQSNIQTPEISKYPLNSLTFTLTGNTKRIVCPSSGFIILSILNSYLEHGDFPEVIAIGFGALPNGWIGHAWRYERSMMARMRVTFLNNSLNPDRTLLLKSMIPDIAVRTAWKYINALHTIYESCKIKPPST